MYCKKHCCLTLPTELSKGFLKIYACIIVRGNTHRDVSIAGCSGMFSGLGCDGHGSHQVPSPILRRGKWYIVCSQKICLRQHSSCSLQSTLGGGQGLMGDSECTQEEQEVHSGYFRRHSYSKLQLWKQARLWEMVSAKYKRDSLRVCQTLVLSSPAVLASPPPLQLDILIFFHIILHVSCCSSLTPPLPMAPGFCDHSVMYVPHLMTWSWGTAGERTCGASLSWSVVPHAIGCFIALSIYIQFQLDGVPLCVQPTRSLSIPSRLFPFLSECAQTSNSMSEWASVVWDVESFGPGPEVV